MVIKVTGNLNNFAISSEGIGEALQRSAAALAQANNDLDQSIALIVAANNVVQNPEAVGTALRTVSMRIRGAKSEMEELGEDTEGMAESVSKLRDELLALSGVDIMLDDSTFKDIYQIMLELARVWDSLTDVTQANILEKIAGKRGANAVASILSNVKDLEAAYVASQNAQGSALAENQKYLESIEGRLSQLSATWQEFWDNAINSDVVKTIISALDALLQFINSIGGLNTAIITLSLSTFIMDLGKLRTRLVGLVKHVANLGSGLSKLGTELKASGTSWGQLFKSAFSGKDIGTFSSKKMVDAVASSYNSALKGSEGDMSAAMLAKQEAMGLMMKQYPNLTDKSRKLTEAMLDEAAATGSTVDKTQKAATAQQVYTAQMKAGKTATDAMTAAQMALKAALSIGIGIAIGVGIRAISKRIEQQKQLQQEILETSKKESEQAKSLRGAVREFNDINNKFKDHKASQEELEPAIRKVTEALGDQAAMLKGIAEGSDEWIAAVEKMMEARNNRAKHAAEDAMAIASDTKTWWDDAFGWISDLTGASLTKSLDDAVAEAIAIKTSANPKELLEGRLSGGGLRTDLKYLINDYNSLQKKIDSITKSVDELDKALVEAEAADDGSANLLEKRIENLEKQRLALVKARAEMTADDTPLRKFFDNVGDYFTSIYTPDNFKEYRKAIDSFADDLHKKHGILKSDMSAIMDVVNGSDSDYQYFQNAID